MVSFWPFKSKEDAASFEKTLSTLSGKIARATARNDFQRQRSRRVRVMWTLYAGFAYILAATLLTLVTGWQKWGKTEMSVVAGGPVLIYIVRTSLSKYYDYRISSTDNYIKNLSKERDITIERLKEATKYNSTQQLLEKYGNSPKRPNASSSVSDGKPKGTPKQNQAPGPRTGMAPPPTANIRRASTQRPATPQPPAVPGPQSPTPSLVQSPSDAPGAEFAPNAFTPAQLTRQYSTAKSPSVMDRIMNALLGEDETQPKNRLALICSECRLVNGLAPPGAQTLEDVGRWRCGGCRAWNGKEKVDQDEVTKLVQEWEHERKIEASDAQPGEIDDISQSGDDSDGTSRSGKVVKGAADDSSDDPPALSRRTTRSKSKAQGRN